MPEREPLIRRSSGGGAMEGDRAQQHWIVQGGTEPRRVVGTESAADHYRADGWRVEGPFVPAEQLRGAVELLEQARDFLAQAYSDDEDNDSPGNMAYALLSGAITRLGER